MSFEFKKNKYLNKNSIDNINIFPFRPSSKFKISVVIPVYGEHKSLKETLLSLNKNSHEYLSQTVVIIVINSPEINENIKYAQDNLKLLTELSASTYLPQNNLNLFWIDASSTGNKLPGSGGVGMARKLGMDASLFFAEWGKEPIIISLDADTLVMNNYLESIFHFFQKFKYCAGSINFLHRQDQSDEINNAVKEYEGYLNSYVDGLKFAGSPYAFHTIGSAMTFRASSYIAAGGMKKLKGGEDFYFMQSLKKLGEIGVVDKTTVFPSARISQRATFGTGIRISESLNGKSIKCYNPNVFVTLKTLLDTIDNWIGFSESLSTFLNLKDSNPEVYLFFEKNNLTELWTKIYTNTISSKIELNSSQREKLKTAFHNWFDAFKTLKFIHFLENSYPEKYSKL